MEGGKIKNKNFLLRYFCQSVFIIAIFVLSIVLSSQPSFAAINETFNIEGKLVNADGTNISTPCVGANNCAFKINIYNAQTLGSLLWTETQPNVPIVNGIFNLKAGSISSIDVANLQQFNRNDLWVEIQLDTTGSALFVSPETFSRTRLSAVPYAMNSKYLGGLASTSFMRSDASTTMTAGTLTLNSGTSINLNSGASLKIADIPQNALVFGGVGGALTSDVSNIYWDGANNILGVGGIKATAGLNANIAGTGTGLSIVYSGTGTTANGLIISNSSTGVITNAIDVSDTKIVNALNLCSNNIVSTSRGEVQWNSSTGENLVNFRDVATNFGLAMDAGAFINRNSYIGEEFSKFRASLAADTAGITGAGFGDGGGWGVYESTNCTFSTLTDTVNGQMRMLSGAVNNGCLTMMDRALNTPQKVLSVRNLPTIIMKVKPSAVSANNVLFVGMADSTDGAVIDPANFVGFTNNGGTTWTGRTTNGGNSTNVLCTGQTISTIQFALLKVEVRSATDIHFFVDNDVSNGIIWSECSTGSATSIPLIPLAPELQYQSRTGGAASSRLDIDFYRAWQDDTAIPTDALTDATANNNTDANPVESTQIENTVQTSTSTENVLGVSTQTPVVTPTPDLSLDNSNSAAPTLTPTPSIQTQVPTQAQASTTEVSNKILTVDSTLASPVTNLAELLSQISSAENVSIQNLSVKNSLQVAGKSILNGGLLVSGISEFTEDVVIRGNIVVSNDHAGYALIKAGQSSVTIIYDKPLAGKPVVVATVSQNPDSVGLSDAADTITASDYYVSESSANSFMIKLKSPAIEDTYFTWHSLSVENPSVVGR